MKKTYIILISVLLSVCFSSCYNKVEELFDKTSAERLKAHTDECWKLLTGAQYGWNIRYYPSSTREFGGTNFVAKFNTDNSVIVSAEVAPDVNKFVESKYDINNSQSVVLSFNTYNDYIHYWSDPDGTLKNTFGGDFEWTYVEGNSEKMIFKGIKTNNIIVFQALKEEMLPVIKKIVNIRDKAFLNIEYKWDGGEENGTTIYVDDDYSVLYYYQTENTPTVIPFTYTETGILFYEPTEIYGITFNEFTYDVDTHQMTAVDARDSANQPVSVVWQGDYTSDLISYESFLGTWVIHYKMSGSSLTRTINMVQRQYNRSYTLKGLYRDLVVYYDKETAPRLYVQTVDALNGIKFCVWDNPRSKNSILDSDGVFFNYTFSAGQTKITLSDIVINEEFTATGFLFKNEYTGNEQLEDTPNIEHFIKQ